MMIEDEPLLTRVVLEGAMGEKFGRDWELCIQTPIQALRLINANKPGLNNWIRENAQIYTAYHVLVEYDDGKIEDVGAQELQMHARIKSLRFVPLVEGAGNALRIVIGAALIITALATHQWELALVAKSWWAAAAFNIGVSLVIGGVVGLLTKNPTTKSMDDQADGKASYYFDGPANTVGQGYPVSLIYGRVLAGTNTIHASLSVQQL